MKEVGEKEKGKSGEKVTNCASDGRYEFNGFLLDFPGLFDRFMHLSTLVYPSILG